VNVGPGNGQGTTVFGQEHDVVENIENGVFTALASSTECGWVMKRHGEKRNGKAEKNGREKWRGEKVLCIAKY
jgi:hypothetical protein